MKRLVSLVLIALAISVAVHAQSRSYLALTRADTLAALKEVFDATRANTDGIGSTANGALSVVDERQDATSGISGGVDAVWPVGETAPHVWVVAPEASGDIALYRIDGAAPSVLTDELLIDDVLYSVARLQVAGARPSDTLAVTASRVRRIIDASTRTVEIPTERAKRAARSLPAANSVVRFGMEGTRSLGARVVIRRPQSNTFEHISISQLLAPVPVQGTGTFKAAISTDDTLTVAEIAAGTSATDATTITIPTWTSGQRYVFIGVPEAHRDITQISQNNIHEFRFWEPDVVVDGYKWWSTINDVNAFGSGLTYGVAQD